MQLCTWHLAGPSRYLSEHTAEISNADQNTHTTDKSMDQLMKFTKGSLAENIIPSIVFQLICYSVAILDLTNDKTDVPVVKSRSPVAEILLGYSNELLKLSAFCVISEHCTLFMFGRRK